MRIRFDLYDAPLQRLPLRGRPLILFRTNFAQDIHRYQKGRISWDNAALLVPQEGIEPPTLSLGRRRSIH